MCFVIDDSYKKWQKTHLLTAMGTEVFNRVAVSLYIAYQVIPQRSLLKVKEIGIQHLAEHCEGIVQYWCEERRIWHFRNFRLVQPWPGGSMVNMTAAGQIWDAERCRVGLFCFVFHQSTTKPLHKYKYQNSAYYVKIQQIRVILLWTQSQRRPRCSSCSRDLPIPNIFSVKACSTCWTLGYNS